MDMRTKKAWEMSNPRVALLLLALNRKHLSDKGKWEAAIDSSGALRLQPGHGEYVLVPVSCLDMPSVVDVFGWIEENEDLL